jgi:hypothetical protein
MERRPAAAFVNSMPNQIGSKLQHDQGYSLRLFEIDFEKSRRIS